MLVQIEQEEYDDLIEQINMLQELVAELSNKPISEYTIDDWQQALKEGWVFLQRNGELTIILTVDEDNDNTDWPVETDKRWLMLDGNEYPEETSLFDIVERIK